VGFPARPILRAIRPTTQKATGLALLIFSAAASSYGQVRGEYSSGSTLTQAGTVPAPGFSYTNQVWYSSGDHLVGPHGNKIPIQNSVAIGIDNNTVTYVPDLKLLGGNLVFSVTLVFANGNYAAHSLFLLGTGARGSALGLSNTDLVPFALGWHLKWADLLTGSSVTAPTGSYTAGAPNNLNSGFWTIGWETGATIYLSRNKATQLSIYNLYAWNTVQWDTGVHPGQNDSVDYSVSQTFSFGKGGRWSLLAGAAGAGQWQTTRNGGQNPVRAALTYRIESVGFTLSLSTPWRGFYIGGSTLWNYGAVNTFVGRTSTINAGLTLRKSP